MVDYVPCISYHPDLADGISIYTSDQNWEYGEPTVVVADDVFELTYDVESVVIEKCGKNKVYQLELVGAGRAITRVRFQNIGRYLVRDSGRVLPGTEVIAKVATNRATQQDEVVITLGLLLGIEETVP